MQNQTYKDGADEASNEAANRVPPRVVLMVHGFMQSSEAYLTIEIFENYS